MKKVKVKYFFRMVLTVMVILISLPSSAVAKSSNMIKTDVKTYVSASGDYYNWDGISNVAQFVNDKGDYCFAYVDKKTVKIVKTKKDSLVEDKISLKMKHPLFGGVVCDDEGNYYLVTGEANESDDTSVKTIFVSKYDKDGKHVKTVGDNGSSSLASYYDSSFYTKIPFDAGNCEIAINNGILAVNYAREMYSGHQSNSVFAVNISDMKKVDLGSIYNSHSFAQRAIPFKDGFAFASEGDCYNRAFTVTISDPSTQSLLDADVFHFWVRENALNDWDMYALNDNFARMGGLANVNDELVALVGTSAKSLSSKAAEQDEQLFIQLFDPTKDLSKASSYITTGKRSGLSGPNGTEKVTDYGVKWLTKNDGKTTIQNPQVVSNGEGKIVVLYEKYVNYKYKGVYYQVLNAKGEITTKAACYSAEARLNPYRMPVFTNGKIYWSSNKYKDTTNEIYIFSLKL